MKNYGVTFPPPLRQRRDRPLVIAHRGNRVLAPENSRAAFDLALAQGADALETDLRLTKDRQIVCLHDATVDRTTDGSGRVADLTLAAIQRLRLRGPGQDRYPDERVLTLDELLAAYAGRTYFLLELKEPAFTQAADVPLLVEALAAHHALDRIILASFSRAILDTVVAAADHPFVTAPIIVFNPWPPARYPMLGAWWPVLVVNPLYVWLCHRRGQVFCPLDPRPEPRLRYYVRLGVDCVLSDDPGQTLRALAGGGR